MICQNCGHDESEHADGKFRCKRFCEHPDCDCSDFKEYDEYSGYIDFDYLPLKDRQ